ncbi:MAG: hypothetical protein MGF17_03885 [Trichodesmium sp. MAG_R04]|nr:hypothetical protein [Trichodesmium sp. MAG_R04]
MAKSGKSHRRNGDLNFRVFTLKLSKILSVILIRSDRLPVRFAIALLEELEKLIDANNRSVVPPVCSAANRNPGLPKILMPLIFLCSIELICLICWLKIVMIINVSFCAT